MKNKWQTKKLSGIATIIMGQSPPSSTYNTVGKGVPFFQGKAEFGDIYPTVAKWCTEPKKIAEDGDVLISVRAPVGPTNINPHKSGIGRGLAAIRPNDGMPSKLMMYLINNSVNKLINKSTGTTFKAIRSADLRDLKLNIPPKGSYKDLSNLLDSLFSKIDAGEEGLQQVQQQLEVYRQAVLKKAFDNDNWPRKFIKDIAEEVRYGSSKKTNEDSRGIPVLRMGNYDSFGNTDFAKLKYLPKNHEEFPELLLKDGDMLFNRTNSSELVGKTMVWKDSMLTEASFASYLIRVRFRDGYLPEFYSAYINSLYGRQWIKNVVNQQVGQANVNGTKLKNLEVPIPPHDIQKQVVEEIKKQYSIIDNLSTAITGSKLTSSALRQSILKKAFNGELI